jgi:hypothetical protein
MQQHIENYSKWNPIRWFSPVSDSLPCKACTFLYTSSNEDDIQLTYRLLYSFLNPKTQLKMQRVKFDSLTAVTVDHLPEWGFFCCGENLQMFQRYILLPSSGSNIKSTFSLFFAFTAWSSILNMERYVPPTRLQTSYELRGITFQNTVLSAAYLQCTIYVRLSMFLLACISLFSFVRFRTEN